MSNPVIALNRDDLSRVFPDNPKVVRAFEQLFYSAASNTIAITTGTDATQALNDATIITLSPNATLNNERIFAVQAGVFTITDNGPGNTVVLGMVSPITINGGFRCTFNLQADTNLNFPTTGRVPSSSDGPYADDAAAAAAGLSIGDIYKVTGGTLAWRQV